MTFVKHPSKGFRESIRWIDLAQDMYQDQFGQFALLLKAKILNHNVARPRIRSVVVYNLDDRVIVFPDGRGTLDREARIGKDHAQVPDDFTDSVRCNQFGLGNILGRDGLRLGAMCNSLIDTSSR